MTRFGISDISDTTHATHTLYFYNLLHAVVLTIKLFTYSGDLASCSTGCEQRVRCRMTLIEVSSGLHEIYESSAVLTATRGLALCQTGSTIYTTSLRIRSLYLFVAEGKLLYKSSGKCCYVASNIVETVEDVDSDLLRVTFRNDYIKLRCFSFVWGDSRIPRNFHPSLSRVSQKQTCHPLYESQNI